MTLSRLPGTLTHMSVAIRCRVRSTTTSAQRYSTTVGSLYHDIRVPQLTPDLPGQRAAWRPPCSPLRTLELVVCQLSDGDLRDGLDRAHEEAAVAWSCGLAITPPASAADCGVGEFPYSMLDTHQHSCGVGSCRNMAVHRAPMPAGQFESNIDTLMPSCPHI